jgi:hypothetical protein
MQVYPVKPEAFLDAILDPKTGENVDLEMNFKGLRAAIDLRQVGTLDTCWARKADGWCRSRRIFTLCVAILLVMALDASGFVYRRLQEFGGFGNTTVNSKALVKPARDGLYFDKYLEKALRIVRRSKGKGKRQGPAGQR